MLDLEEKLRRLEAENAKLRQDLANLQAVMNLGLTQPKEAWTRGPVEARRRR